MKQENAEKSIDLVYKMPLCLYFMMFLAVTANKNQHGKTFKKKNFEKISCDRTQVHCTYTLIVSFLWIPISLGLDLLSLMRVLPPGGAEGGTCRGFRRKLTLACKLARSVRSISRCSSFRWSFQAAMVLSCCSRKDFVNIFHTWKNWVYICTMVTVITFSKLLSHFQTHNNYRK